MRLPTYLLAGLAAVVGLATASVPAEKRSFTATCGHINQNLVIRGHNFGHIDSCTCLEALSDFVATNPVARSASQHDHTLRVTEILYHIIEAASHGSCTYPTHSIPNCSGRCGFSCKAGFFQRNGQCVVAPSGRAIRRELGADQKCPFATTKCGVYDQTASRTGFECIDTKTNLESCGGCTIAYGSEPATGVDCTAIPGATDFGCQKGACVVTQCKAGWSLVGASGCEQT